MSDADDELESIRRRKREQLRKQTRDTESHDAATGPAEPVHIEGGAHLQELVGEYDVVLVDFYADWCGPCKMLEPIVASVAADTPAAVAKVDVDAYKDLASEYQVQGVPTLYLFSNGEPVQQMVGVQDEETLKELVEQHA